MEATSEILRSQIVVFFKRTFQSTKLGPLIGKAPGEQRWGPLKKIPEKKASLKSKKHEKSKYLCAIQLAPVVQRLDNAIHRINHYPADSVVCFVNTYPLDSDLSGRQRYPAFEQPGPGR